MLTTSRISETVEEESQQMDMRILIPERFEWVNVGYLVRVTKDRARQSPSWRVSRQAKLPRVLTVRGYRSEGNCEACGRYARLSVHHIKPLWVLALDFILPRIDVTAESGEREARFWADLKKVDFASWHTGNLQCLCADCHAVEDAKADRDWKKHFEATTAVIFGERPFDRALEAHRNRLQV